MLDISLEEFTNIAEEEYANLPYDMCKNLDNVLISITNQPPEELPRLYGLYHGHPLTHRNTYGFGELPDQITLYSNNIQQHSNTTEELRAKIRITLIHELGHYFGMDDKKLHELGWY